jgi:hypothetical protein
MVMVCLREGGELFVLCCHLNWSPDLAVAGGPAALEHLASPLGNQEQRASEHVVLGASAAC